jgi:hypothetical protein
MIKARKRSPEDEDWGPEDDDAGEVDEPWTASASSNRADNFTKGKGKAKVTSFWYIFCLLCWPSDHTAAVSTGMLET